MTDVFDKAKRSDVMSRIRSTRNRSTELILASAFRAAGITGWRRHAKLHPKLAPSDKNTAEIARVLVKPDFIFRKQRLAIFVDGCFWHGCQVHATLPKTNTAFWQKKITQNIERDSRVIRALNFSGWETMRIWEHELSDIDTVLQRIRELLDKNYSKDTPITDNQI